MSAIKLNEYLRFKMIPQVIGISGRKRVGKDFAGGFCKAQLIDAEIKSFAHPLKQMCKVMFDFTEYEMSDAGKDLIVERWGISPRQALIFVGTDLVRKHTKNLLPDMKYTFWAERMKRDILKSKYKYVIITDVRFEDEIALIHELGGKVIKVTRDGVDKIAAEDHVDGLISDYVIENNGTIDEFRQQLYDLLNEIVAI